MLHLQYAGDVYTFGWNRDGQLGHGDDADRHMPTLVEAQLLADTHIVKVHPFY
jgi:alpha-tubulin suppressor-like RCC1 family protein